MKRIFLDETSSTNDFIKQFLGGGEDVVVCAGRQTGGKGTKGRAFLSERGGVYLSLLTFYGHFSAENAFTIMTRAAVAVCKTCAFFGLEPEIKWCNDVLVGGKKIAGILIENTLSDGLVRASIVGIGLNVSDPLTGLENVATSMAELLPHPPQVETVRDKLLEELLAPASFSDYLGFVKFLGKRIEVTEGDQIYTATAREILPDGRLLVEKAGELRALAAAEISITL